jgi:hypothetical protein
MDLNGSLFSNSGSFDLGDIEKEIPNTSLNSFSVEEDEQMLVVSPPVSGNNSDHAAAFSTPTRNLDGGTFVDDIANFIQSDDDHPFLNDDG